MKEVCGAQSRRDKLIIIKHQVDRTQLLIYFYILPYLDHSRMITLLVLLLQCIRPKNCTEMYSNSRFLVYFIYIFLLKIIVLNDNLNTLNSIS